MTRAGTALRASLAAARERGRSLAADAVLAGVATIVVQEEIWFSDEMDPRLALSVVGIAGTVPLAWRRTAPAVTAVVVSVASGLIGLLAEGPLGPQFHILALAVALYTAAAYATGRARLVAAVLTLPLVVVGHAVAPDGDAGDFFPWAVWGAAWLTGSLVQRRTLAVEDATRRAVMLQHEQQAARAEAAAQERDRIARELHDVVAHAVSVMVVQAGAERLRLTGSAPDPQRTADALAAIEETGRQAMRELRAMLAVLREGDPVEPEAAELGALPGLSRLQALVERLRGTGLPVTLHEAGPAEPVPAGVELSAYRIAQEALTNVLRHAGSVATTVSVVRSADGVEVTVANLPGRRTGGSSAGAGRGLLGMRERAAALGGRLVAGPTEEGGFCVRAFLPRERPPASAPAPFVPGQTAVESQ